ncbi:MAG: hypothetical protein FWE45_03125 [Firmicutes bacterium]|nr:hypothetical protein [Bacillota bacterium]
MDKATELIALASTVSIVISKNLSPEELTRLSEFLGLLRHNLDVVRHQRAREIHREKKSTE